MRHASQIIPAVLVLAGFSPVIGPSRLYIAVMGDDAGWDALTDKFTPIQDALNKYFADLKAQVDAEIAVIEAITTVDGLQNFMEERKQVRVKAITEELYEAIVSTIDDVVEHSVLSDEEKIVEKAVLTTAFLIEIRRTVKEKVASIQDSIKGILMCQGMILASEEKEKEADGQSTEEPVASDADVSEQPQAANQSQQD